MSEGSACGMESAGSLATLSDAAARHGAVQCATLAAPPSVAVVARALYAYGRSPLSPRAARRLRDVRDDAEYLAAVGGWGALGRPNVDETSSWLFWAAADALQPPAGRPTYKLYVSPIADVLPDVFRATMAVLGTSKVVGVKVGLGVVGLLHPDRIVAHFASREACVECGERVLAALAGVPAHGVPFTAPLGTTRLVSWGADPPRRAGASRREAPSWRGWVCDRLATHLRAAARAGGFSAGELLRRALPRLRLDGVNTDTWAPDFERAEARDV